MGPIDMGPSWMWKGLGCLVVLGTISLAYLISKGIIWLFNHVTIE